MEYFNKKLIEDIVKIDTPFIQITAPISASKKDWVIVSELISKTLNKLEPKIDSVFDISVENVMANDECPDSSDGLHGLTELDDIFVCVECGKFFNKTKKTEEEIRQHFNY